MDKSTPKTTDQQKEGLTETVVLSRSIVFRRDAYEAAERAVTRYLAKQAQSNEKNAHEQHK